MTRTQTLLLWLALIALALLQARMPVVDEQLVADDLVEATNTALRAQKE